VILHSIEDWDDAYANGPNIPGGERWPEAWVAPARAYRDSLAAAGRARLDVVHGERPRQLLDLFLPEGAPKGLVVFVHGGFWLRLDKSHWSHLARGAVDSGHAVAVPGYSQRSPLRWRAPLRSRPTWSPARSGWSGIRRAGNW
jgi:acetyl esterase/lipase